MITTSVRVVRAAATVCVFALAGSAVAADRMTARRILPGDPPALLDAGGATPSGDAVAPVGLRVLLPVIGRLVGGGQILYSTSLNLASFASTPVTVDYVFHGNDVKTGTAITFGGVLANDGGTHVRAFSGVYVDDVIDAARQLGGVSAQEEADGVLGSATFLFENVTTSHLGSVSARFSSMQFGGTIGVAINAPELDGDETTAVMGSFLDTRGIAGIAQLYSNIFLTNFGHYDSASRQFIPSTDKVTIKAFSNSTGQQIGSSLNLAIATGQTISTGLGALGVPPGAGLVIVLARATSGQGILTGVGAAVDATTTDPSVFQMSYVPSNTTGPPGGTSGDLASQVAGDWSGGWLNNTFSSSGSATLAITTNTTAHTFSATLHLTGNVFGGSAPPDQTFSGSYSTSTGVSYSGHSSLFGDIAFTVTPAGAINGVANNVPSANVSKVTFSGTASAHLITINYTVNLKAGGTASGVVTLTK